jgi:hypothetical protein
MGVGNEFPKRDAAQEILDIEAEIGVCPATQH